MSNAAKGRRKVARGTGFKLFLFGVLLVLALVVIVVAGWIPRHRKKEDTDKRAKNEANAVPTVQVFKVRLSPTATDLIVPGTTSPIEEAFIYARANGYLKRRLVDIGDRVRKGQLLAVIDAPDLDAQVAQARASVQQSENNLNQLQSQLQLATVTWNRWKVLVAKGVFSRQEGDQQEANFHVAEANVRAAENTIQANRANLERMIALQEFEQVRAPFDGVITARNIDVGALISAQGSGQGSSPADQGGTQASGQTNNAGASGSSSANASPSTGGAQGGTLFTIDKVDRLRILVSIPEGYASAIHPGQRADLHFQEMPKQAITARVTRMSGSVDQNTRTVLVEVQVENASRQLMPGMYVTVNFIEAQDAHPMLVPGDSIVVRNAKTMVALVKDDKVQFRPVEIGRDYGDQTEIVNGLNPGEIVAMTVSDEVHEGAKVKTQLTKDDQEPPGGQSNTGGGISGQYGEQGAADQTRGAKQGAGKKGGGQKGQSGDSSGGKKGSAGKQ